jgi:hypothetical protein
VSLMPPLSTAAVVGFFRVLVGPGARLLTLVDGAAEGLTADSRATPDSAGFGGDDPTSDAATGCPAACAAGLAHDARPITTVRPTATGSHLARAGIAVSTPNRSARSVRQRRSSRQAAATADDDGNDSRQPIRYRAPSVEGMRKRRPGVWALDGVAGECLDPVVIRVRKPVRTAAW